MIGVGEVLAVAVTDYIGLLLLGQWPLACLNDDDVDEENGFGEMREKT